MTDDGVVTVLREPLRDIERWPAIVSTELGEVDGDVTDELGVEQRCFGDRTDASSWSPTLPSDGEKACSEKVLERVLERVRSPLLATVGDVSEHLEGVLGKASDMRRALAPVIPIGGRSSFHVASALFWPRGPVVDMRVLGREAPSASPRPLPLLPDDCWHMLSMSWFECCAMVARRAPKGSQACAVASSSFAMCRSSAAFVPQE